MIKSVAKTATVMLLGSAGVSVAHGQTAVTATGQSGQVAQGETSAAAPSTGLEEIVVTAQRRSENLQRVPISITALTGATLEKAQVNDTQAIVALTPGLQLNSARNAVTPFLRGVGSVNISPGDEGASAIYVDGVLYAVPGANVFGLSDVDRIEVLKGPQGTLFGRNAVGGLINVITRDPTQHFTGDVEAGYGNYNTFSGSAYVAGGLTNDIAASLAVSGTHQGDGWGKNYTLGTEANLNREVTVRGKVVANPGSGTKITLTGDYTHGDNDIGSSRQALPGALLVGGYTFRGSIYDTYGEYLTYGHKQQGGVALRIEQDLGTFKLQSTTALREYDVDSTLDSDGNPIDTTEIDTHEKTSTVQQELLLTGKLGRLDLTGGFFYFYSNARYRPFTTMSGTRPILDSIVQDRMLTNSYAGFAQATYHLTDTTGITGGIRYTSDRRQVDGTQYTLPGSPLGAGVLLNTTANLPSSQTDRTFGKVTWRAAIDQRIGSNTLLFASASRGFKSGVFALTAPFSPAVTPETLNAYEVGIKSDLFDRSLRLNISGFHYNYDNIQLTTLNSSNVPVLVNAAKGRINGVDGDLIYVVPHTSGALQFRASASYLDAKYTSFPDALTYVPLPTGGNAAVFRDVSGNRFVQSPKFTTSVGFNLDRPIGNAGTISLDTNYYHNDGFFWDVGNRLRQNAYNLVNAQLSFAPVSKAWQVRVWVKNLTDTKYYSYVSPGSFGDAGAPAAPRTFGAAVRYNFN